MSVRCKRQPHRRTAGTDRPNTFKINALLLAEVGGSSKPTIGLYQQIYSGTPLSSYMSVAGAPVFVEGRGKYVQMTRDTASGNWIAGSVTDARTPHFAQTGPQRLPGLPGKQEQ